MNYKFYNHPPADQQLWFCGSVKLARRRRREPGVTGRAHITLFNKADTIAGTPAAVTELYKTGPYKIMYYLYDCPHPVSREYDPTRHWGHGVYLYDNPATARQSGPAVSVVTVEAKHVATVLASGFADRDAATRSGELARWLDARVEIDDLKARAPLFWKGVKEVYGRDKKAIQIIHDDRLELVVYDTVAINTHYCME
jgi:hypothetical protein